MGRRRNLQFLYARRQLGLLLLAVPELFHLVLIVRMVRIAAVQEIELGIAQFILTNASLEFGSVSRNETGRFINDICLFIDLRKIQNENKCRVHRGPHNNNNANASSLVFLG